MPKTANLDQEKLADIRERTAEFFWKELCREFPGMIGGFLEETAKGRTSGFTEIEEIIESLVGFNDYDNFFQRMRNPEDGESELQ